jgi:hypothetical protein
MRCETSFKLPIKQLIFEVHTFWDTSTLPIGGNHIGVGATNIWFLERNHLISFIGMLLCYSLFLDAINLSVIVLYEKVIG